MWESKESCFSAGDLPAEVHTCFIVPVLCCSIDSILCLCVAALWAAVNNLSQRGAILTELRI